MSDTCTLSVTSSRGHGIEARSPPARRSGWRLPTAVRAGDGTYRGVTVFDAWENGIGRVDIVEVTATGQESWIQLAGMVLYELGHVLTGT